MALHGPINNNSIIKLLACVFRGDSIYDCSIIYEQIII